MKWKKKILFILSIVIINLAHSQNGDCSSSGTYQYLNNSTLVSSIQGFVANNPGDYITLTFTTGETEIGWDYWFINDAANGLGNTIATGDGSFIGNYESITGEISF